MPDDDMTLLEAAASAQQWAATANELAGPGTTDATEQASDFYSAARSVAERLIETGYPELALVPLATMLRAPEIPSTEFVRTISAGLLVTAAAQLVTSRPGLATAALSEVVHAPAPTPTHAITAHQARARHVAGAARLTLEPAGGVGR